jgi:uncharacterized SAM-dependent methyltransferase
MQSKLNLQYVEPSYSKIENDLAQLIMGERSANLITHEFCSHQSLVLWNAITKVPDYYLTQDEITVIHKVASKIGAFKHFVDLGPGSDENALAKALPLIDATGVHLYRPVDISPDFANKAGIAIKNKRDHVQALPIIGDWEENALNQIPEGSLVYYSGGSVENVPLHNGESAFDGLERHLTFLKQKMGNVSLLVTVDVNQDQASLESCYNTPMMRWFNHSLWQAFEDIHGIDGLIAQNIDVYSKWDHIQGNVCHIAKAKQDMNLYLNGCEYVWREGQELVQSHSIKPTQNHFASLAQNAGWNVDGITGLNNNTMKMFLLS